MELGVFLELRSDSTDDKTPNKISFYTDYRKNLPVFESLSGRFIYPSESESEVFFFQDENGSNEMKLDSSDGWPVGRHLWRDIIDNTTKYMTLTICSKVRPF